MLQALKVVDEFVGGARQTQTADLQTCRPAD